jgi:hypothetical protein
MLRIYWKDIDIRPAERHQVVERVDGGWWISDFDTYSVISRESIDRFTLELLQPLEDVPQKPYWKELPQSWSLHRAAEGVEAWSLGEQQMIQLWIQGLSQMTCPQPSQQMSHVFLPQSQVWIPSWVLEEVGLPSTCIDTALHSIQSFLQSECPIVPLKPVKQPLALKEASREQTALHSQSYQKTQKTPQQKESFSSPLKPAAKQHQPPLIQAVPSPFPKGVQVGKLCPPTSLPEKQVPRKSLGHPPKHQQRKQRDPQCQIVPEQS